MTFKALGKITAGQVTADKTIKCARIQFAVAPANTGKVYLGSSGLNKTTLANVARVFLAPATGPQDGMIVQPINQGANVHAEPERINAHSLSDYWIDADNASDGLFVCYWIA